ncbi:MAG: hypothetical protein ACRCTZ_21710 [Sarcina sp.]
MEIFTIKYFDGLEYETCSLCSFLKEEDAIKVLEIERNSDDSKDLLRSDFTIERSTLYKNIEEYMNY